MNELKDLRPKLTVVGVGGAGSNAVNNMIRSGLEGVNFVVCNTDAQALEQSLSEIKIQLGPEITQGLGAGSRPDVGKASAEESLDDIMSHLKGTNMIFITAGMGGGTGTGGAPVIAQAARDAGILTVGVVTRPFHFEGSQRMQAAEKGIEEMNKCVDTLLVIPNQNLFRLATENTTFSDAFAMADDVLYSGVRTFTDLMIKHGLINLDFADICAVMREMIGKAMMGTGQASGERRAIDAAEQAISCPLLDSDITMKGARAVLINITGGPDMTLFEVDEAANRVREEVDPNAKIIFGATYDQSINGEIRVAVVATGIDANEREEDDKKSIFDETNENVFSKTSQVFEGEREKTVGGALHATESAKSMSQENFSFGSLGSRHDLFSSTDKEQDSLNPLQDSVFDDKKNTYQWVKNVEKEDAVPSREGSSTKRRAFNLLERLGMLKTSAPKGDVPSKQKQASPPTSPHPEPIDLASKKKEQETANLTEAAQEDNLEALGQNANDTDIPAFMRSSRKKNT